MQFHNILNKFNFFSQKKHGVTIGLETLKWALNGPVDIIILVVFTDCFANRVVVKWKFLGSELLSFNKLPVLRKVYDLDITQF